MTIKTALILGFGVTIAVWLWAGYELTQRMSQLEEETSAVNRRFMRAQERLLNVRTQVLLASLSVRDALLDPSSTTIVAQREQFRETCRIVQEALARYEPVTDSADERVHMTSLRREVDEFEQSMRDALETDDRDWTTRARVVLKERVIPKRQTVIDVSDQVQTLNGAAFMRQRAQTAALYRDAERQAWNRLGGALGVSLAVGLVAAVYARRLENRVKQQRFAIFSSRTNCIGCRIGWPPHRKTNAAAFRATSTMKSARA